MSDLDLESIEDPNAVDHPSPAPNKRMVRWIAAVAVLVVIVLGVTAAIKHDHPLAKQVAHQNAGRLPSMITAPPPRYTAP
jgi:hypothetical protein